MKAKVLILFFLAMLLFIPNTFAFSWQNDVDLVTQDVSKSYEVYPDMQYSDYASTWSDVPGWTYISSESRPIGNRIIFRKNETSDDGVVEEFYVDCDRGNNRVMMTTVAFKSKDEKIINRIFNYALTRINVLTKQNKKRTYDSYKHRLSTYVSWTLPAQRAHINVASGKDSNNSNTQTVIICKENYLGME
ncbi:hypothetical protein [Mitsuokella jalaludinii]|uniref:hypothetical protein n=1 Tax=Mitsuokella jalaludinii TaxID=187979 RepID=UPI0006913732|nr:hypothetical protein [Mitsuokella jalaludinii]MCQ1533947.1 hypothetical protein [Mitsuokella jalaludinii]